MEKKIKIFDFITAYWMAWSITATIAGFVCWIAKVELYIFIQIVVGLAIILVLYGFFELGCSIIFGSTNQVKETSQQNQTSNNKTIKNEPVKRKTKSKANTTKRTDKKNYGYK